MDNTNRVMVGVSGPAASYPAIDWAVDYAAAVQAEVELVHVVDLSWRSTPVPYAESVLLAAEHELRDLAAHYDARTATKVHATVLMGHPADLLMEHAAPAALLVLGTHAADKPGGYVFSPLAVRVAGRTTASTVVVPHVPAPGHGIVVGVDGSAFSAAPLAFAAREADRLGEPLIVVHAWGAPRPWGTPHDSPWATTPTEEERRVLAEALAGVANSYPDLVVRSELVVGWAADALERAAVGARMLVVGSNGRHGFDKAWLGSTSEDLLFAMPTTVAVIRAAPSSASR